MIYEAPIANVLKSLAYANAVSITDDPDELPEL